MTAYVACLLCGNPVDERLHEKWAGDTAVMVQELTAERDRLQVELATCQQAFFEARAEALDARFLLTAITGGMKLEAAQVLARQHLLRYDRQPASEGPPAGGQFFP